MWCHFELFFSLLIYGRIMKRKFMKARTVRAGKGLKSLYFCFNLLRETGLRRKVTVPTSQVTYSHFAPGPGLSCSPESIPGHSALWIIGCGYGSFHLRCWLIYSFYHLKINHEMEDTGNLCILFLLSLIQMSYNIWKAKTEILREKVVKVLKQF